MLLPSRPRRAEGPRKFGHVKVVMFRRVVAHSSAVGLLSGWCVTRRACVSPRGVDDATPRHLGKNQAIATYVGGLDPQRGQANLEGVPFESRTDVEPVASAAASCGFVRVVALSAGGVDALT